MELYAVIGNPIQHSRSPEIHQEFAKNIGHLLEYKAICLTNEQFEQGVKQFFAQGGKGLNVTLPFKQLAYQLSGRLTERASLAGAVNTLYQDDKSIICGDNTDGVGLVRDIIANHNGIIKGKRLLLLGAGGAARGVLHPLMEQQPESLVVANRTLAKAVELAGLITNKGRVSGCGFDSLYNSYFDLIINASSASLHGDLPPLPTGILAANGWCYDMMYGRDITKFCQWGITQGAEKVIDGLGMLVEQAAESFYLWRGIRPDTELVIRKIRNSL